MSFKKMLQIGTLQKISFVFSLLILTQFSLTSNAHAIFGMFEKKTEPKPRAQEKLSEDDKIGYISREEKDLKTLKQIKLFVPDAIDANCAFKIKSVLQDNDAIYKVEHSDFKNFTVYFDSGQNVDLDLIKTIVTAAGYNPQIKP
jgi:hypothetical protein